MFPLTKPPLPYDIPALETRHLSIALSEYPVDTSAIQKAAKLINEAHSPIIIAGGGLLSSPDGPSLLAELSKNGNIPVTTTMNGIGTFDETDKLALHMYGMFGSAPANVALQRADVIVTLGARFINLTICDRDLFAPAAKAAAKEGRGGIIQFELREQEMGRIIPAAVPVLGDVVAGLAQLVPLIEFKERAEWSERVQGWKTKYPFAYDVSKEGEAMTSQEVIHELDRQTEGQKDNIVITTGVGQHQICVAHHYRFKHPKSWVSSGRLGVCLSRKYFHLY
jgi:acetolactate synthase-1/2/3 large subunit